MKPPRDEMNEICHVAGDLATEVLEDEHFVSPFAVVLLAEGEVRVIALDPADPPDDPPAILERLRRTLQSGVGEGLYRATAVVSDVQVKRPTDAEPIDALRIQMEHVADIPITCFLPYRRLDDRYEHQSGYLEDGERLIFPSPPSGPAHQPEA